MLIAALKKSTWVMKWGGLAALAFGTFAVWGEQGLLQLHVKQAEEGQLEELVMQIQSENESLQEQIKSLQQPEMLEKVVRRELGFLRPNEVIYYIGQKPDFPPAADAIIAPLKQPQEKSVPSKPH